MQKLIKRLGKSSQTRQTLHEAAIYRPTITSLTTQQPFYGPLSGTTGVSWYQKKHHPPTILIIIQFLSASSIYCDPQHPPCSNYVLAWQSFCTASLHVFFGLPLGLEPSTSYSQSGSSFRNICPYRRNLIAVIRRLYHLFLVILSTPYFYLNITHLSDILISAC